MVEEINNMPDKISIIVPCYNEEEVFDRLIARIRSFLDDNNIEGEAIFVDDGSQDQTWTKITDASKEDARISGLKLSRNWGHQAAVAAGLRAGNGDVFVVMDADLQDPPELITDMIDKWREGYEVVYGVRSSRRENILKKCATRDFIGSSRPLPI
jgi:polyisoprenyl-phosphate glycosyltransferase